MNFIKPKIIISKCLEFDSCRYDAKFISNKYIKDLKKFIDFTPVCPEVEIGMGIPRETIKIIENKKGKLLHQSETGKNFINKMNIFSNKFLNEINQVDGFIVKSKSPSCGFKTTNIFSNKTNKMPIKKGNGIFTDNILKKFPMHPIKDEKQLNDFRHREHFYTSIFTLAEFRKVDDFNKLYKYHTKHKYLFMSYNQLLLKKMGDIAANRGKDDLHIVLKKYYTLLLNLFQRKSRDTSNINTYMHVMGYFKKMLSVNEKKYFLEVLKDYRTKKVPLSHINTILSSWIVKFESGYLREQSFFRPFPQELIT